MTYVTHTAYPELPKGIRCGNIDNNNGLKVNFLEAGFGNNGNHCILLLHGFPELAYSWRKIMVPLAKEGYHVVAPDLRGYGATTGWDNNYDGDLEKFSFSNLLRDNIGFLTALGHRNCSVVGHDFGSPVAAYSSLARPDIFKAVVLMSAPFAGTPEKNTETDSGKEATGKNIHLDLANLSPPRKHYQWYYSTRKANEEMVNCKQGIHDFLRAYYHHKSANWERNQPHPLRSWTATELAKLPTYYVMHLDQSMPETVAKEMPSTEEIKKCTWLTDAELSFYAKTYSSTGFQGGLQHYRIGTSGRFTEELRHLSGSTIDVPSAFIAGKNDWGIYQKPGAFVNMQEATLTNIRGCHLIDSAGHWVQQEQPESVVQFLKKFLHSVL
jgi:pimeloyl-ACP methyl ester carboxylesterase